jgi:predicted amidohydrolase YtcJ
VIADAWLPRLRALGAMVVGQPALVAERGDVYRGAYPTALHGWLHRAGSLLRAGVGYAAGSDAPVTEPAPGLGLSAARQRRTPDGAVLGADERLGPAEALAAFTLGPAQAVGVAHALGRLRPGMLADIAVLDPEALEAAAPAAARRLARVTLMEGRVVWRREGPPRPGRASGRDAAEG